HTVANRIREAIRATPTAVGVTLTTSVGIAVLDPAADATLAQSGSTEELIKAADAALYAAKRLGGDSCLRFTPKPSQAEPVSP
ncbi:MAG: GGDEF domain-containing protein, partial [Actinomycetota bacterium]|nr:GGDEF domain-containing protein [Actinomycetota bacterium]